MKQLVVERNNPDPILWDTPIPQPGPGEVLIKNHFSEHIALLQMQRHLSWYAGGQDRVRSFRVSLFSTKTFDEAMNVFNDYWISLQNYKNLQKVV